jgi:hypothetical protein
MFYDDYKKMKALVEKGDRWAERMADKTKYAIGLGKLFAGKLFSGIIGKLENAVLEYDLAKEEFDERQREERLRRARMQQQAKEAQIDQQAQQVQPLQVTEDSELKQIDERRYL